MKNLSSLSLAGTTLLLSIVQLIMITAPVSVDAAPETKEIVPGAEYEAGPLHRLVFGAHWRDLWTTKIRVPVLNLKTFAGGLTPTRKGGGNQTRGLRFQGADGKEYKFRSINKDPQKILPPEMRDTLVADVVQDQISTANPSGAIVVGPLARAVGVWQTQPEMYVMPDDPKLGEFRETFKGMFGTVEEVATVGGEDTDSTFEDTDKLIGTYKLYKKMEADLKQQVDAEAFLRARLLDIFIGDWDRHRKQWKWARKTRKDREEGDEGDISIWHPVAMDRDQAFVRFDGILPWLVTRMVRYLNDVDETYPRIEAQTWGARHLDRRLLNTLEKKRFIEITAEVKAALTDAVIDGAVRKMPPEMFAKEGENLIRILKARRDALDQAGLDFYELLAKFIDLRGSEKNDWFEVNRLDDQHLQVQLFKPKKSGEGHKKEPYYDRVFNSDETKEIRLYTQGGNDLISIQGKGKPGIWIRVIDPGHQAKIQDSSQTESIRIEDEIFPVPEDDVKRFDYDQDYAHDWWFMPLFNASSDVGLLVGGGPILYQHDYQWLPYSSRQQLRLGYAFITNKVYTDYNGDFRALWRNHPVFLDAKFSQIETLNFYGYGNDSVKDPTVDSAGGYKIKQSQFTLSPSLAWYYGSDFHFLTGMTFKNVDSAASTFAVAGSNYRASADATMELDTRDVKPFASRGHLTRLIGSIYPALFNGNNVFGKASWKSQQFFTFNTLSETTLEFSAAGEKRWGTYPFEEAAFLGSDQYLRGFSQNRFAGDSMLVGGADIRFFISHFKLVLPGRMGGLLFVNSGRVFQTGESSNTWHTGYGGGFWGSFLNAQSTLLLQYAHSVESDQVSLGIGLPI